MESKLQGFWEGRASAMTAAREKAQEHEAKGRHSDAESVLASAHYSRATTLRTRGLWWLPIIVWHFWRARRHVRKLLRGGLDALSPEQLDVAGTILKRRPLPDIIGAARCFQAGISSARVALGLSDLGVSKAKVAPHTLALLYIGLGECQEQGDTPSREFFAPHTFHEAALLIGRIEREEPDLQGKRQLVRVLKHCGAYFKRVGDPRGEEFLARAKKLAEEVSSDQLAKIGEI